MHFFEILGFLARGTPRNCKFALFSWTNPRPKPTFWGRKFDFAQIIFLGQTEGAEHAEGLEIAQKGFYSAQRAGSKGPKTAKIGYFMLKTRKIECFVWFWCTRRLGWCSNSRVEQQRRSKWVGYGYICFKTRLSAFGESRKF